GNLTNTLTVRARLVERGMRFATSSDSEMIARMIAEAPGRDYVAKIGAVMGEIEGAYSLALLTPDALIGVRDPHGVRPLTLGRLRDHWIVASESCAIETVGGVAVRDVLPGEVVVITGDGEAGLTSVQAVAARRPAACLFEFIYFARPDSYI